MTHSRIAPALTRTVLSDESSRMCSRRHHLWRGEGLEADRLFGRAFARYPRDLGATIDRKRWEALHQGVEDVRVGTPRIVQPEPKELDRGPVLGQHRLTAALGGERGEGEHHSEVVGQLRVGERQPRLAIDALEPEQG